MSANCRELYAACFPLSMAPRCLCSTAPANVRRDTSLDDLRHEPRLRRALVLDQPARELRARLHAELVEDARQVVLHRVLAHFREVRDLAVALAELDPLRDLGFALAQRREPRRAIADLSALDHAPPHPVHERREVTQHFRVLLAEPARDAVEAVVAREAGLVIDHAVRSDVDEAVVADGLGPLRRGV